ncbi:MAG: NrfD/PsrC family molybdoenzyme membrane anchor subunit [Pseudonocardia sp.]
MVPEAEFTSYYGRPILKQPTWKSPDVPLYLWVGGMAGTSSVLAAVAGEAGRRGLRRWGRLLSAGGAIAGTVALVHDLGRPARFLYMLRVVKPTSPLSVGTWILSPFAALAAAAAASELSGIAPRLGRFAGWGAAALGPPLASYTAVLVADTAVPAWHEAHRELPVVFVGSAAAAGGGAALVVAGLTGRPDEGLPAARVGALGGLVELVAEPLMRRRLARLPGGTDRAYTTGHAGRWHRAARVLTAAGALGAVGGLLGDSRSGGRRLRVGDRRRGSRLLAVASGLALAAGSLATRFAVFEAGRASAADPAHVVGPQRERLARNERARAGGSWLADAADPITQG